jgi:hypothetical protein
MATTTTNFGWDIPQSTDLVKDGATAIAALGQDIDTAMVDLKGGTTGQVLAKASGTDLDFSWVAQDDSNAIQNAIVDAKGDLIAATAADTPARLAVGTNGQFLIADSSAATGLAWANGASALPAFSAYAASNQTITSATWTKVTFGSETFDTNTNFASSRFTPTVAGYYQVNTTIGMTAGSANDSYMAFYKNGSIYQVLTATATLTFGQFNGASLIYCNGSTDYIEVYVNKTGSGTVTVLGGANGADSWFNGVGVRA